MRKIFGLFFFLGTRLKLLELSISFINQNDLFKQNSALKWPRFPIVQHKNCTK